MVLASSIVLLGASVLDVCATVRASGLTVPGATVVLVTEGGAGASTTGEDGCARFEGLTAARVRVTVAVAGAVPVDLEVGLEDGVRSRALVELDLARDTEPQEMVVEATRERVGETRRSIAPEEVRMLPGAGGDALKAVQNLPGLARPPFGLAGLLVRGAAPGDTKAFLDGQEIPQLYHFGGLTSVVSTELLSSIDFLPGGFGVRYGGAIGGVVDASTSGARDDRWSAVADVSPYHAQADAEGPIGPEARSGRIFASARRSYIDAVLPALLDDDVLAFSLAPRYYDYQARYDAPPGKAVASVLAYGSDDALTFLVEEPPDGTAALRGRYMLHTLFHRAQASVAFPLAGSWTASITPAAGWQSLVTDAGELLAVRAKRADLSVRAEASGDVVAGVCGLFGIQGQLADNRYRLSYADLDGTFARAPARNMGASGPGGAVDLPIAGAVANSRYATTTLAAYGQAEVPLGAGVTMVPGVRVDGYLPAGHVSADPRLALRWTPSERWSFRSYLGLYHQPPQFQQWDPQLGRPSLRLPYAVQTGVAGRRRLGEGMSVETELFWKWLGDQVAVNPADPGVPGSEAAYGNGGIGRAYGLELLVRQDPGGPFHGWIAYTLSRSERADPFGAAGWRPYEFDQTHILTAVTAVRLGKGWNGEARFRYTTGNPTTGIVGATYDSDADRYVGVPGKRNGDRLPDFHQLDLRLDRSWDLPRGSVSAYLDLQNVYLRRNPEAVRWSYDYQHHHYLSGLSVLPLVGIRGEF